MSEEDMVKARDKLEAWLNGKVKNAKHGNGRSIEKFGTFVRNRSEERKDDYFDRCLIKLWDGK